MITLTIYLEYIEFNWRTAWQPTPVFFPGESHRQRSLVGYSPWGHKELDMTEQRTHCYRESFGGGGLVAQSCLTPCDPMDCNLLGFSVHGILQARILE